MSSIRMIRQESEKGMLRMRTSGQDRTKKEQDIQMESFKMTQHRNRKGSLRMGGGSEGLTRGSVCEEWGILFSVGSWGGASGR